MANFRRSHSGTPALGETPEPGGGPDIQAAAVEGRRGDDGFAEFVAGEDFETVGSLQHHAHSRLREDTDLVAGGNGRGVIVAQCAQAFLLVERLSGDGVETRQEAAVAQEVKAAVVEQRGRAIRQATTVGPEDGGRSEVSGALRTDRHRDVPGGVERVGGCGVLRLRSRPSLSASR